ncbi:hypothetical protein AYO21_06310 [Fonsecaea monophora]|uniref:Uncharacterized protein n=1 Tax=Fonsecaea monophora TaxID=254056 RepID=A0A177F7S6_9EURO|nr:hypothetical protein AYO21_06310 [Fonsecaea monophora]KAH0831787.1 hypothetical protein FOPE_02949 [Fonsecaea pedrosoi]OAG39482.1 hypothetical protein AYO21_06310 [Fonsecaea monophora]
MAFWEHAGFCGRGVNGDIAQLFAELEAYRIAVFSQSVAGSSRNPRLVDYGVALHSLQSSLLKRYKHESKWLTPKDMSPNRMQWWGRKKTVEQEEAQVASPKAIERSIYLAHSLYLINAAFEKPWLCTRRQCPRVNGRHTEVKRDCGLVRYIFHCGLEVLSLAGENEEAFSHLDVKNEIHQFRGGLGGWHPRVVELFHEVNDVWRGSMIPLMFF